MLRLPLVAPLVQLARVVLVVVAIATAGSAQLLGPDLGW
jgi:hypothetical protein